MGKDNGKIYQDVKSEDQGFRNILVPRFDSIGDIILLEGFVERLLETYPDACITVLVHEDKAQLASLFPESLQWMTTSINPYIEIGRENLDEVNHFLKQMTTVRWDMCIFTTYNRTWLDDILAARLTDTFRVALNDQPPRNERWFKILREGLELPQGALYDFIVSVDERSHETEKYQRLSNALFKENTQLANPQLRVPENAKQKAGDIISCFGRECMKYFVCATEGTQNISIKKWPAEKFSEVIYWVHQKYGWHPILTGHETERDALESLAKHLTDRGLEVFVWVGKTGELAVLAAILQKAALFVGNDTGPMHMAAALGIPTVGIYGGGTWPRFTPSSENSIAVVGSLPCFGCYWDCIFQNAPCLNLVSSEDFKKAVEMVIEERGHHGRVLYAAIEVSKETCGYIEKVIPYIKESTQDRSARLESIYELQWQLRISEIDREARLKEIQELLRQLQASEADRQELQQQLQAGEADRQELLRQLQAGEADRQELLRQLQAGEADRQELLRQLQAGEADRQVLLRQLQVSEADRAARLEAIYGYQSRLNYLSRPETILKSAIILILQKARLYPYVSRYQAFFSRIFNMFFKYVRAAGATKRNKDGESKETVSPVNAPVVEALVSARSLDGGLDETDMVCVFEHGKHLKRLLCIYPSLADIQAMIMLSKAGTYVTCIARATQAYHMDLRSNGIEVVDQEFPVWLSMRTKATLYEYDGILLGESTTAQTIMLLKGRLWPQTGLMVNRNFAGKHDLAARWGKSSRLLDGFDLYDSPPPEWLDPAHPDCHYYRQTDWPWIVPSMEIPPMMPSGSPWPKISIVTVNYNQGKYLEETVRSVLSQGYPNIEYILIDGGSTDQTKNIIRRYQSELSYCVSEKDEGQSDALNKGFMKASGDILAWLNSDDCYLPGTLWRVALAFDTYDADMVAGGCALRKDMAKEVLRIHHNTMPIGDVVTLPLERLLDIDGSWQKGDFFYQPEVFWTRSLWERSGGFVNKKLFYSMDYELWLRFARNNAKIVHIPDTLALFRLHDQQKTTGEIPPFLNELYQVRSIFRKTSVTS